MKRLICLSVTAFSLVLAGCGKESDELPVDGRDFDGVEYSEPVPYTGKVIDGYLNNARVWLDMDGDSQYTPGPLVIELENGQDVTLDSGEPTAMSGPGGRFTMDISGLALDPAVGPDLDPRNYPLYAVALPDKTLEETRNGEVPVASAYIMSAPPGVRNVTPLTTLAHYRGVAGLGSFLENPAGAAASLAGLNLVRDYILVGDDRSHAYARALARFMASQIPAAYNDLLAMAGSDGTERFLSKEAVFLLGLSLVQNAEAVIAVVDAAEQGGYGNIDVDALELPEVSVELSDPVLLTSQKIYAEPASQGNLPASRSSLLISAELTFDYSEGGRLLSVSANGCLAPSMRELARLVSVSGRMADLESQWLPSVALSEQSRINYDAEGVDERLTFDWDNQRIYFEAGTTCHDHEGVSAGSTELGGNPEVVYSWTIEGGDLVELVAEYAGGMTRRLVPETANAPQVFPGYRISQNGSEREAVVFASGIDSCRVQDDAAGASQVVTGRQAYEFSGYEPQPAGFSGLMLEFDTRALSGAENSNLRLLRYGFMDPALSDLSRVTGDRGFEWVMNYAAADAAGFYPEQPGLIRNAYLKRYSGGGECGREFDGLPVSAYARVEYGYQRLSAYLLTLLD
ncbi:MULTISPECIES: hypothetical protein [Marinobacter]|uniref:Lipoprotein n=1 Tax=Marinobacter metalliresistant TaxID=2961995 RepID=A0ABZ2W0B9_9GAMM|nr:hypothetical protein [Marinobacter sp. Arc7-DN-1]AXS84598.1 hypothetical protein D0851_17155 [Marinobacter sp. Arc7-DN-1]